PPGRLSWNQRQSRASGDCADSVPRGTERRLLQVVDVNGNRFRTSAQDVPYARHLWGQGGHCYLDGILGGQPELLIALELRTIVYGNAYKLCRLNAGINQAHLGHTAVLQG